jgi:microcystin-dependent protein
MAVNRYYSSSATDTVLDTGIDASATQIILASTAGMPQSYPFTLAIGFDLSTEELVNVVGAGSVANSYKLGTVVGNESVTGRGIDGTTAQSHAAGVAVRHVFTARDMREAQEHIDATGKYTVTNGTLTEDQDLHGIGTGEGVVVGTAKTQTLTNKTMSGAQNTFTSIPQNAITNLSTDLALKAPLASPTFTGTVTLPTGTVTSGMIADGTITNADINASAAIDWTKLAISSTVSATEIGYVDGVTSSIQTQINTLAGSLGSAVPTGTVSMYAGTTAPTGYLICDGSAVSRTTYSALFTAISTVYGNGDGSTTFNLPDLRGRAPIGVGQGTGLTNRTLGAQTGTETVTLTEAQMPSHTHSLSPGQVVGTGSGGTSNYAPTGNNPQANTGITSTGGGQAHPNMQPSIALNFIIKH